jgi:hypothetical protein
MLSGILGAVSGVTVSDWDVSVKASPVAFVNSATKSGHGRRFGNQDWSGGYNFHPGAGAIPASLIPGYTGTFVGVFDNSVAAASQIGVSGPVIVDELQIKWDIEGAKVIEAVGKFSGNGAYTLDSLTAAVDSTPPMPLSSIGCTVSIGAMTNTAGVVTAPVSYTPIPAVRTITLTMKRDNKGGVNSGTAGWMNRRKGNFDATLAVSVHVDDLTTLPAPNTELGVQISVDGSHHWDILGMIFGDISGLKVDPASGALIGATLNAGLDVYPNISGAAITTCGTVKMPGGSAIFP